MRIVHYANHAPRDNADENAVTHALRALGHDVLCVESGKRSAVADVLRFGPDFLLTHKEEPHTLRDLKCRKVFFYFDMIESADWDLQARSKARRAWLDGMTEVCDVGFLTDGDAVAADTTGKLHHLMQGADERVTGPWGSHPGEDRPPAPPEAWAPGWTGDILFTGSVIHGGVRANFVDEMKRVWGNRFLAFGHKPKDRVHGRKLAELLACAKVVVCPDGPVTDRYCSNRLVQALGFGAFVTHPLTRVAWEMYPTGGYESYSCRKYLHEQLESILLPEHADRRSEYAAVGFRATIARNLYRHRCAQLVDVVRAKLNVGKGS